MSKNTKIYDVSTVIACVDEARELIRPFGLDAALQGVNESLFEAREGLKRIERWSGDEATESNLQSVADLLSEAKDQLHDAYAELQDCNSTWLDRVSDAGLSISNALEETEKLLDNEAE